MLTPADAWRLSLASRSVSPQWKQVQINTKCSMPILLGMAQCSGEWTVRRALSMISYCDITPYENPNTMLRCVLRHVLTPTQMYEVASRLDNVREMRLALSRYERGRCRKNVKSDMF